MKLYNSLTRQAETFEPRTPGKVQMFVCGPTVYDLVHLGNARTFTAFDMIAQWLRYRGYTVNYIQNITDIDDKIIARAVEQGRDPLEYAREYEQAFLDDMRALGNDAVSQYARATDHIPQVIAQVKILVAKGHAYLIDGVGWYFDLATFPNYGKLSGRTVLAAEDAVTRIDDSEKKRNVGDFCVWKLSKPGEPVWEDIQLGAGRPGWHIEDTAITEHFFGPQYDLHGGAIDLKFPHHEAEVAQQESASGKVPFVKYWMHAGFLEAHAERMGKSKGNFATLRETLAQWPREVIRFYLLSNHYRAPLAYSPEGLDAACAAVQRIGELRARLDALPPSPTDDAVFVKAVTSSEREIDTAMDDDFNVPRAFAAVFSVVQATHKAITRKAVGSTAYQWLDQFLARIHAQFGIVPEKMGMLPNDVQRLVADRESARERENFSAADALRSQIIKLGYTIDDTPYGPLVKKG